MVAYTKPQQRKKEESEQLKGERDKIKSIDLRFERKHIENIVGEARRVLRTRLLYVSHIARVHPYLISYRCLCIAR